MPLDAGRLTCSSSCPMLLYFFFTPNSGTYRPHMGLVLSHLASATGLWKRGSRGAESRASAEACSSRPRRVSASAAICNERLDAVLREEPLLPVRPPGVPPLLGEPAHDIG